MLLKSITLILVSILAMAGVRAEKFNCSNPTSYWQFRNCCNSPGYFAESILNECRTKHLVNVEPGTKREVVQFLCVSECIFNETEFFTDGKINVENINKTLVKYFNTPIWESVLATVLPICITEVIEKEGDLKLNKENMFTSAGGTCSFMPLLSFACLNLQIFRNCPVPFWVISDRCAKVKKYDDRCSLIPGIPRRL